MRRLISRLETRSLLSYQQLPHVKEKKSITSIEKLNKTYVLISPSGEKFKTNRLKDFCTQFDLKIDSLQAVSNAKRLDWNGWLCFREGEELEVREKLKELQTKKIEIEKRRIEKLRITSTGRKKSKEEKEKIGKAQIGNKHGLGYKHTEKSKEKISEASKRLWKNKEHREKMSDKFKGNKYASGPKPERRKRYVFLSPENKIQIVDYLIDFCKQNNLSYIGMYAVFRKLQKKHKGWTRPNDQIVESLIHGDKRNE